VDEGSPVALKGDLDAAVALMSVRGAWGLSVREMAMTTLDRCLSQHPEALIIDLSELDDPACASAATWLAAQCSAAARRPAVQLALCIPPRLPLADRLQRLGSRGHLPVYARVRQARVAIAGRLPTTERITMTLAAEPDSPSLARNLAGEACLSWELPELLSPARLVMSELVTNAVEHARSPVTVTVSRRGTGLQLTVTDGDPGLPRVRRPARPRPGRPLDDRGRGLRVVTSVADAWGALPTSSGKVVWAAFTGLR